MHTRRSPGPPIALLAIAAALAGPPARAQSPPPLIPRSVLFSAPERAHPRLSPDGKRLAYLARSKQGALLLWVRTLATGDSVAITREGLPEAPGAEWTGDGKRLLFLSDTDGDENWHLHAVDVASREIQDVTPFPGVRAELVAINAHRPNEVLVGLNRRDPAVLDVHRIDLSTGAVTLDTENPGDVTVWTPDDDLVVRAATALDPKDGSTVLRVRDSATAPWRELVRWPLAQSGIDRDQRILAFVSKGRELLVQTPIAANTTSLVAIDVATGKEREVVPADERADLWNVPDFAGPESKVMALLDLESGAVHAVAINGEKPEWKPIDAAVAKDLETLAAARRGVPTIVSRDQADRRWVVSYLVDDGPVAHVLYDRGTKRSRFLFYDRPTLLGVPLAAMQPITVASADGKRIPAYISVPPGVPANRLPMVVVVHGGPWFRDAWGFQPDVQWLVNRGYAVLQVNFRGSTGYGRAWLDAGNGEFGPGRVLQDITTSADWAVGLGIADPSRIAIMGTSFGGYATLCGLAWAPYLFACGVDVVGPANLKTLFQSFPPYWGARLRRWKTRMGDVVASDSLNQALSPLFHVDQFRAPLLVGHGANDPRVKLAEAETIVKAVRDHGGDAAFVVYANEGHGFTRPENQQDFGSRVEAFLAQHLGGRQELPPDSTASAKGPKAAVEVR